MLSTGTATPETQWHYINEAPVLCSLLARTASCGRLSNGVPRRLSLCRRARREMMRPAYAGPAPLVGGLP